MDLDSAILGVVELRGVDARCVAHAASAQVFHRARPIPGAKLFVMGDRKGRDAAVGFAIEELTMPREALRDCFNGDLGARLEMQERNGLTTIKAAHLACHEGCGSFWEAGAPRRKLSQLMARWRTPITLAALGIRWRSPTVGSARPDGNGVARLLLKGQVTEDTSSKLVPAIQAARGRTIALTIDSPGGSTLHGRRIYDSLAAHPYRVEVSIHEVAHSIASVIAMAGDRRKMGMRAEMLVHESYLRGMHINATNGQRSLRLLESSAAQLAAIYATACDLPIATTRGWMKKETVFTAVDALRAGLIHEIMTPSGTPLLTAPAKRK